MHIWFVPGSQRQRPVSKRGRHQNIPPCYDIISVQCLQRWGLISWVHKQCWARILTIRYCISGGFPCHNTCLPNPAAFSRSSLTVLFWIMNSQKIQRYLYICTKKSEKFFFFFFLNMNIDLVTQKSVIFRCLWNSLFSIGVPNYDQLN